MADCLYCEKPAGLLKKRHQSCEDQYQSGLKLVTSKLSESINNPSSGNASVLSALAADHYIKPDQLRKMAAKCWSTTLDGFLDDGLLDESEQKKLEEFAEHFDLEENTLNQENNAHTKAQQALVLTGVMNGKLPQNVKIIGPCPVNLQKNEQVVWVFQNTLYYEDKIRRTYVGASKGVSVRVAKGVYYRTGAFKGHPIEQQERVLIDNGITIITNKNIYFAGPKKSFRVPYNKIVSFMPFEDGIGFIRDTQTAKPQVLSTGSGWFTYNLITNLAQMES